MSPELPSVVIVDDHELFRAGVRAELEGLVEVRAEAGSVEEAVAVMNDQDARALAAVKAEAPNVAKAVRLVAEALRAGGRLIYVGAGTSGRLGVLDASECPPTFRTSPEQVQGIVRVLGGLFVLMGLWMAIGLVAGRGEAP